MSFFRSVATTLEMIKWEHSIFALPFALTGAMLAARGLPSLRAVVLIILCMVTARSAAMAFNRWADADLDAKNPRTSGRAIPAGQLDRRSVGLFTAAMSLAFLLACSQLNRLTLILSPAALLLLLSYSYTKRFTRWSHLFLGLGLGIAPSAAWIAVRGSLDPRILILTGAVLFWVAGFDVLYACQDAQHDRAAGLNSFPQAFGISTAFWAARGMHLIMLGMLAWLIPVFGLGWQASLGLIMVAALLLYEHLIISPRDLRRLNAAFFTMNGVISVLFFLAVATDLLVHH